MSGDLIALVRRLPGCAHLAPERLSILATSARIQELAVGTRLLAEGEPAPDWYCVVDSGAVQLTRPVHEGDEILDYLSDGDILDAGVPGTPSPWTATVVEPGRCALVPRGVVADHQSRAVASPPGAPRDGPALFFGRLRDLVTAPPVTCSASTPVADAARLMTSRRVGSVIVVSSEGGPLGIVTDRDLRTRVVAVGLVPAAPVSAIMSSPLVSVDAGQMVFDGLIEMTRRNIHHLGVEERGRLIGVVSSHDLLLLQGAHPVALAREIEGQASVDGLVAMALRVHPVVKSLVSGGAGALDIGRIVAELNDRLVGRAVRFAEATLEREGLGRPPVPYSWLAAGSEGRREQTLRTDQDNGLLYEDPAAGETGVVADYFARLATVVGATLVRLGFPLCEGGFMATNPRWRQPASVWREYFDGWMEQPLPERLLSASIFLDLRPVAGDPRPGAELWEWVCERAPSRTLFLRHMAREAVSRQPPLGFFGRFVVERTGAHRDHLDLKARGVFPMTQGMRAYALSQGIRATNTVDRLAGLASQSIFAPAQAQELREAYGVISRLRLTHQLGRLESGQPPDNFVDPDTLGKADRLLLKEAFKTLGWLQRGLEDRFLTSALP